MENSDIRFVRYLICICIVIILCSMEIEGKKKDKNSNRNKKIKKRERMGLFTGNKNSESFENPQDYKIECCQNGGTCFMGTFCHCLDNYFGRYCEYRTENRACGRVNHGYWFKSGCNLCRCFDGRVTCINRAYSGCDHLPKDERDKYDPNAEIYIFTTTPPRSDYSEYDYYDNHDNNDKREYSSSSKALIQLYMLLVLLLLHHL